MSAPTTRGEAPAGWAFALVRARVLCLVAAVVVTAVTGAVATRLTFNFSPDNLFLSGDPTLAFYLERQVPAFGAGDNTCVIAVEGDLTDPAVRETLVALHRRFAAMAGVDDVQSLLTAVQPDEGAFGFSPLLAADGAVAPGALERAAKDPLLKGLLLGEDLEVAAVYVRLDRAWGDELTRQRLVHEMSEVVRSTDEAGEHVTLHLAGVPISQDIIVDTLKRDQLTFVPLVMLVMGTLLFLSFRDLRGVILPFLATGSATVWALGYLVLVGHEINVVNNAIVVLLLVIGIADAVHMVARFEDELARARRETPLEQPLDKELILARTVEAMFLPCLLTTTTTAIGFGSSFVADMGLIREFGIDAAVGVLLAFVATMLLVPSLLGLLPLPEPKPMRAFGARDHLTGWLDRIGRFSLAHARGVLAVGAALFALSLALASQVSANQKLISELPDHDDSVRATRFLEAHMAGILPFDVVFVAEDATRLTDPDVVRAMAEIERFIAAHPVGATTRSYAKVLSAVDRALAADRATPVEGWSDEKVRQLQLLFDMADARSRDIALSGLIAADAGMARVTGLVPDVGTDVFSPFRDELRARLDRLSLPGVTTRISGGTVIASRGLENIVVDLTSSLAFAIVAILAFISLLFRSLRFGLIALVPNVLPIVCALAAMTLLDVELRVATVIIFSMSLGVAVDSGVHLLARLREELARGDGVDEAMLRTLRGSGRPVVYAVGLLLLGFVVMGLSEFRALRDFSVLSGLTLGAALVVCVGLVPALVKVLAKR